VTNEQSSFFISLTGDAPQFRAFKLFISSLFIPGSILHYTLLGMNQNFLPLASELMSGSELFIPTRNIIGCSQG